MSYIYEQLSTHEIARRLRADKNAGWSYEGAVALAECLEQLAEYTGNPIELDVVAMRCEFSEYDSLEMFNKEYGTHEFKSIDELRDATTVIEIPDTERLIVQSF